MVLSQRSQVGHAFQSYHTRNVGLQQWGSDLGKSRERGGDTRNGKGLKSYKSYLGSLHVLATPENSMNAEDGTTYRDDLDSEIPNSCSGETYLALTL